MSWPISLPDANVSGYQETFPDTVIRSTMDVGPDKIRRRTTAAVRKFRLSYDLTRAEVETLNTFYETSVEGGALPFTMKSPRTEDTETFRFMAPPDVSAMSGVHFRATCSFEEIP